MSPVGVAERAELPAADEGGQPVLHPLEIVGARLGPVRDGLGQVGGRGGVSVEGADDIHPVQGVQVVEVDDVVLYVLDAFQDVAQNARIVRDFHPEGIFDSSHGAECVYSRSDTANALGHGPGFAGIAPFQDEFDPAEHGAGRPGFGHRAVVHLDFDAQVAFDAGDGVNCYSCHRCASLFWSFSLRAVPRGMLRDCTASDCELDAVQYCIRNKLSS